MYLLNDFFPVFGATKYIIDLVTGGFDKNMYIDLF